MSGTVRALLDGGEGWKSQAEGDSRMTDGEGGEFDVELGVEGELGAVDGVEGEPGEEQRREQPSLSDADILRPWRRTGRREDHGTSTNKQDATLGHGMHLSLSPWSARS